MELHEADEARELRRGNLLHFSSVAAAARAEHDHRPALLERIPPADAASGAAHARTRRLRGSTARKRHGWLQAIDVACPQRQRRRGAASARLAVARMHRSGAAPPKRTAAPPAGGSVSSRHKPQRRRRRSPPRAGAATPRNTNAAACGACTPAPNPLTPRAKRGVGAEKRRDERGGG